MGTRLEDRPHVRTRRGIQLVPCAPHDLMERLGDRWTMLVLALLEAAPEHRLRFGEIRHGIRGISQRMLTVTLRHLERNGMVLRHYFPEVPPRVEYELSALGRDMVAPLGAFADWVRANWPAIERARAAFDGRNRENG